VTSEMWGMETLGTIKEIVCTGTCDDLEWDIELMT
jgi:hypothetical protein